MSEFVKLEIPVHNELILKTWRIPNKNPDGSITLTEEYTKTVGENSQYFLIKNEYMNLINSFREKEEDQFIGGMPVQLEKDCLKQLLRTDSGGNLVYIITLKADGERYLMFLSKNGTIYFINRSTDLFYFKNKTSGEPLGFDSSDLIFLFDGELVKHPDDTFEFLIFDVIFYHHNKKVYSWMSNNYTDRHFMINKALTEDLKVIKGFTMSMKPWFSISDILKTDNIYKYIIQQTNKQRKGRQLLKEDGLILQPLDGFYVPFREWNKPNNVQFKWKPPNQLTIDFKIKEINKRLWHLLTKTDQNYNISQKKGKPVPAICIPSDKNLEDYHDGDVAEFRYSRGNNPQGNLFTPVRLRNEKSANSYKTIMSTLDVIKNPFNLDILKPAIQEITQGSGVKEILKNYTKSELILMTLKNKIFFNEKETESIKKIYTLFTESENPSELEFRVFQRGKKGNIIDRFTYFYLLEFLLNNFTGYSNYSIDLILNDPSSKKYRSTYRSLNDIYNGTPESNMYKLDISSFILFPTDKGQQLYNNLVLKLNLSNEIPTDKVIGLKNEKVYNLIRSKKRFSFKIGLWRIDITRILSAYKLSDIKDKNETYELECEYIGKNVPFEIFINSMSNIYKFILNNTSYC
jgi:hypothetical protein